MRKGKTAKQRGGQSMVQHTIEKRKYLVDALNEVMPELHKAYARAGKGRHVGLFLHQMLALHADEATLETILGEIKREIAGSGRASMDEAKAGWVSDLIMKDCGIDTRRE